MKKRISLSVFCLASLCALLARPALAGDEIQIYTNDLRKPGESGVEIHANYTPRGSTALDWAGQVLSHHAFNLTPEFSWGLVPGMDWGLYVPTTRSADGNWHENGLKLRIKRLFNADKEGELYYGANFELAWNRPAAVEQRWSGELRTIIGKDFENWLLAANVTFGFEFSGPNRTSTPDLAVSLRALRKLSGNWNLGIEHYAEVGRLNALQSWNNSGETSYLVTEYESGRGWGVQVGVGHGWTGTVDGTVVKAIVGMDF
jgi:hypothetical protein